MEKGRRQTVRDDLERPHESQPQEAERSGLHPQAVDAGAGTQRLAYFTCLREPALPRAGVPEGYPSHSVFQIPRGHLEKGPDLSQWVITVAVGPTPNV